MIRTLLVDDHVGMRQVIRHLLERDRDIKVVGEARDGEQALRLVETLAPDVVVLDVIMSVMDGFKVLKAMRARPKVPKVVMFSMNDSAALAERALAEGASAFVPKRLAFTRLVEAVREAAGA